MILRKRGNQFWCKKTNGEILLINMPKTNEHYNGAILFMKAGDSFNENNSERISHEEWLNVRENVIDRIKKF